MSKERRVCWQIVGYRSVCNFKDRPGIHSNIQKVFLLTNMLVRCLYSNTYCSTYSSTVGWHSLVGEKLLEFSVGCCLSRQKGQVQIIVC